MPKSGNEPENILARFKANQGLSTGDIASIFQVSGNKSSEWMKYPDLVPDYVANAALALNIIMERWKKETGSFNDVDYQHLMHSAHLLEKENLELKKEIVLMKMAWPVDSPMPWQSPSLEKTKANKAMFTRVLVDGVKP